MKKLIAVLTLMFAFAISASAQDKKMSSEEAAKLDAIKMTESLGLQAQQQMDFQRLFMMKHDVMNDPSMSAERKTEMARVVDLKLRASLTPEQLQKLDSNPELLARLTGTPATGATKTTTTTTTTTVKRQ